MNRRTPDNNPVAYQAIEWLSDLQDGKTESAALFRWLAESPRHVEEFTFVLMLTDDISGLTAAQCAQIAAMNTAQQASESVTPLPGSSFRRGLARYSHRHLLTRRHAFLAAAGVATVAIGLGLWAWDSGWQTYLTAFGEQKMVELQDGSTIHLNTESRVKVRYNGTSRDIRLLYGEALFKVQRDPAHPFRVHADEGVIQAVGTQFNVYQRSTGTIVSVLEGSVRITPDVTLDENAARQLENLTVGHEAQLARQGEIVTRQIDVRQAAAWRQHRLVFLNDSLADIAAEFNRYNRKPEVIIEDEEAGRKRFAASFDVDAPEALVQVLKTNPELVVERVGNQIRVRSENAVD